MRLIPFGSLTPVPWKNGGGVTRQIAVSPPTAGMEDFEWRISTAEVAQDGPFSRFEGIDRRLYILSGEGLDLDFGADDHRRLPPGAHADFPGEAEVTGRLVGGAVTDLNIMVRRQRLRAHYTALQLDGPARIALPDGPAALFVQDGEVRVEGSAEVASRHDTLLFEPARGGALAATGKGRLLLIGFEALR